MTQEDKELLLKDLCARLPYGVKCCTSGEIPEWFKKLCVCGATKDSVKVDFKLDIVTFPYVIKNYDVDVKPYLRPMKSMTDKEFKDLYAIDAKCMIFSARYLTWHLDGEVIDYLNSRMLDWRGLIPKGLALEAPEDMYKI